jgi:hypoxanthine phosphoribosyltransferase
MAVEIRETLLSEAQIQARVRELAERISRDYADRSEVLLVGVLRGAFIFLADLCRQLSIPVKIDFIAVSSYGMTTESTGAVRLILDVRSDIAARHVIVVEDIVDRGYTLRYLREMLAARKPASLRTCALVRKPDRLLVDVQVDYLGFDIPDVWVVGYGLDCMDQYRHLPVIAAVEVTP